VDCVIDHRPETFQDFAALWGRSITELH
jgi:hypothetical protein